MKKLSFLLVISIFVLASCDVRSTIFQINKSDEAEEVVTEEVVEEVIDEEVVEEVILIEIVDDEEEIIEDVEYVEAEYIEDYEYEMEEEVEQEEEPIFMVTEVQPSFPGGDEAREKFFKDNLKYPESQKASGIEGKVWVKFVVEKDGSITNITIPSGLGGDFDKEAIRVISMMPNWNPAKQRNIAVRSYFVIPVEFKLQ